MLKQIKKTVNFILPVKFTGRNEKDIKKAIRTFLEDDVVYQECSTGEWSYKTLHVRKQKPK